MQADVRGPEARLPALCDVDAPIALEDAETPPSSMTSHFEDLGASGLCWWLSKEPARNTGGPESVLTDRVAASLPARQPGAPGISLG